MHRCSLSGRQKCALLPHEAPSASGARPRPAVGSQGRGGEGGKSTDRRRESCLLCAVSLVRKFGRTINFHPGIRRAAVPPLRLVD